MIDGTAPLAEMLAAPIDTRSIPVRVSHLKAVGRSPAHGLYAMRHDYEPTLAMRLGSAGHSLLLGGPPVIEWTGGPRTTKAYKDWSSAQEPGAILLTSKEAARARGMAAAVRAHGRASAALFAPGTVYERTIHWEQLGRARRSTPDARSKSHLVDLKTCRTAQPGKFQWDAIRMGYHAQLADYRNAMIAENGYPPKDVYIIAVEQLPPHTVAVYELSANALEQGDRLCRAWLETLLACEASGHFPGYCDAPIEFDIPNHDDDVELTFSDDETSNEETEAA